MTHPHLKYSPNVFCDLGCCVLSNVFLRIWGVFWLSRIFIFFLRKEICALRSLLSFSVFFILVSTCWGNDLLPPHLCPPFHIVPPPHLCPPFHIVPPPPTCVLLSTLSPLPLVSSFPHCTLFSHPPPTCILLSSHLSLHSHLLLPWEEMLGHDWGTWVSLF